ncbi:carbonic anhydrase-like [Primulina tabacum]|uniref:carbonic anhydrase-like n=1 Tax=Primulina tabacum TaxID=48773 RepID=UPI003F5AB4C4
MNANMVPPYDTTENRPGTAPELGLQSSMLCCTSSVCGRIKELMSFALDGSSNIDFIEDWVKIYLPAKKKVIAECRGTPFGDQCALCEKEAVNVSLGNLLSCEKVPHAVFLFLNPKIIMYK